MNKKAILIIGILAILAVPIALMTAVDDAHAMPSDDYRIWGTSKTASGSSLILAIDETARVVYPVVSWSIYVADDMAVKLETINGVLIDEILAPGIHDVNETYATDAGAITVTWTVADKVITYKLNVAYGASSAAAYDAPDNTVSVTPDYLSKQERNVAIGCIICALAPSLILIPYWQRKKDEDYYYAF